MAVEGANVGLAHQPQEKEDVPITLRLPLANRSSVEDLKRIKVIGEHGNLVPLGELVKVEARANEQSIYHKNLMPVVYVTGDVAGQEESPVYVILQLNKSIDQLKLPEGYGLERYVARQPFSTEKLAMKWDGEWHITYEVFRDLGLAFAAVLVLIYILVVGWFQSFKTPFAIMAAIPFSLVGILPAHALMGAFFTATSMIGFIAGAGIVVRNSIILVDFVQLRLNQGMSLADAVVDAGAVRFRPMMLTAAAVIVGAGVILFDPIFQGLAISLMAGEVASLFLSRMTVPVLFYLSERKKHERQVQHEEVVSTSDEQDAHLVESTAEKSLTPLEVQMLISQGALVVDIRRPDEFAVAHIPGALNINLNEDFTECARALLDPSLPLVIMADDVNQTNVAATKLAHLGIADVKGFLGGGIYAWQQAKFATETITQISAEDLHRMMAQNGLQILDVREADNYARGHVSGALNFPITQLELNLSKLDTERSLVLMCAEGHRSSTAASLLARKGFPKLYFVNGGISAWIKAGYAVEESVDNN
jgi:rhodanese-related sulfurtransferase